MYRIQKKQRAYTWNPMAFLIFSFQKA